MSLNQHTAGLNSEAHLRGSVITVSTLQQRHVLLMLNIRAIPEGVSPKRTMDCVAPLAEAPASARIVIDTRALPSCALG